MVFKAFLPGHEQAMARRWEWSFRGRGARMDQRGQGRGPACRPVRLRPGRLRPGSRAGKGAGRLGRAVARWRTTRWGARIRHPSCRGRHRPFRLACPVAAALVLWAIVGLIPAPPVPPSTPPAMRIRLLDHAAALSGQANHPGQAKRSADAKRSARPKRSRTVHQGPAAAEKQAAAEKPAAGPAAAVGAMFYRGPGGQHFCTATVVRSPARDLIVTAAHCADPDGHLRHFVFVPGYQDGRAPYGVWEPRRVVVGTGWSSSANPADDVAFVVMSPSHGRNIGDVIAGEGIGRSSAWRGRFRVIGYPDGAEHAVTCANSVTGGAHGLEFDCPGFTDGTSGGPWLAGPGEPVGAGWVAGVIGGYEQGGVSASVSYSPVFGQGVMSLYRQAVRTGRQFSGRD